MQRRRLAVWAFALGLLAPGMASTAPAASVRVEVEFLLASIRDCGCMFFRNGTWHEGKPAEAHLREKFDYLLFVGRIARTEDFIEGAATRSSLSGLPYLVKCAGSEAVASDRWLRERLVHYRTGER